MTHKKCTHHVLAAAVFSDHLLGFRSAGHCSPPLEASRFEQDSVQHLQHASRASNRSHRQSMFCGDQVVPGVVMQEATCVQPEMHP